MISSRLIGRTSELAELEAALADADASRPSLAFVAGESGVGKSRLISELGRRAGERGVRVLAGECVELGEGELPYAPIVGALRPLVREADPVFESLPGSAYAELAGVLPGLGATRRPGEDDRAGPAQARMFEALLTLLHVLGEQAPVLLVIEDLHWADSSTRACLAFLARSLAGERVLLVTTYRADELHRRHPLRPLLAELERAPHARRIDLDPLTREELAEQLADILGDAPDEDMVERLWARSEGNPLFAEELLAAGLDGRGETPPTLRDALMLRVERLPGDAQEMLRLLAIAGTLDHDLLCDAAGLDGATLREALRAAVGGHLVRAGEDARYGFRHALLREVVHDDLLPGERTDLHLALAAALERRAGRDGHGAHLTAGIAHHRLAAGDQPGALRAAVRAAEAAERVHAFAEAAALLERALELWSHVPAAGDVAGADHAELLVRAGHARDVQGDTARAVDLLAAALGEVDADAHPHRAAGILERLSRAHWHLGQPDESDALLARGLDLLGDGDRSPERAGLLAWQAKALMLRSEYGAAIAAVEGTLDEIRSSGDASAASRALNALGSAVMARGELERGAAYLLEAAELGRHSARPLDLESAYNNRADVLHQFGRTHEALDVIREVARELADHGRASEWLDVATADLLIALGEWDAADAHLSASGRRGGGMTRVFGDLVRAELALGRGEHDMARRLLDDAASVAADAPEAHFRAHHGAMTAELERRAGDVAAARAAVDGARAALPIGEPDLARRARVAVHGLTVEGDAAQRARDLGDEDAERAAIERATGLMGDVEDDTPDALGPVAGAWRATAAAEFSRVRGPADPKAWAAAAAAWETVGWPLPIAQARWRHAEALAAAGERDEAGAVAAETLGTARELGAGWLAGEIEGLATRARLRLGEAADEAPAAAGDDEDPFGLTERERQVLGLLAQGATNREIGAALFMAEKTASVHVSRILAKLEVRSRTEAAHVAHRHGLAV